VLQVIAETGSSPGFPVLAEESDERLMSPVIRPGTCGKKGKSQFSDSKEVGIVTGARAPPKAFVRMRS